MNNSYFDNNRDSPKQFEIKSQKLFAQLKENFYKINYLDETISNIKSLPDKAKKEFSEKVIGCFEHEFYEAAIMYAWRVMIVYLRNICIQYPDYIQDPEFPKNDLEKIRENYKESELINIMYKYRLLNKDIYDDLKGLLSKRNMGAHPSSKDPDYISTISFINDVVRNIKEIEERLKDKPPFQN